MKIFLSIFLIGHGLIKTGLGKEVVFCRYVSNYVVTTYTRVYILEAL